MTGQNQHRAGFEAGFRVAGGRSKAQRQAGRALAAAGVLRPGAPLCLAVRTVIRGRDSPARGSAAERNWPEQAGSCPATRSSGDPGFAGCVRHSGNRGLAGEGRRWCQASVLTVRPGGRRGRAMARGHAAEGGRAGSGARGANPTQRPCPLFCPPTVLPGLTFKISACSEILQPFGGTPGSVFLGYSGSVPGGGGPRKKTLGLLGQRPEGQYRPEPLWIRVLSSPNPAAWPSLRLRTGCPRPSPRESGGPFPPSQLPRPPRKWSAPLEFREEAPCPLLTSRERKRGPCSARPQHC